jgi:hypothetical protein
LLFFVKKTWKKKVQGERPFGRGFTKSYWGKLLALNRFWPQNQRFLKKRRFFENSRRSGRETHFSRFLSLFAHFFCTFCTFRHKFSIIGTKPSIFGAGIFGGSKIPDAHPDENGEPRWTKI